MSDFLEEDRQYFGRQKPFDEYAMGVIQDTFERKLDNIINKRPVKEVSVKTEINDMICPRKTRSVGYFSRGRRR